VLDGTREKAAGGVARGGYVLAEADSGAIPDLILIATGSELQLAVSARVELESEGIRVRVVSLPCWELFAAQPQAYRDEVLPPDIGKRVSIEAGVAQGWERWVGPDGAMICVERFGASAPGVHIFAQFGFSAEHVCEVARGVLTGKLRGVVAPVPDHVAPGDPT
ncbi:MAG TPA: transketolase C-terminal domain-containing protein, partial [Candidatus Limnocylindria bacterium]|nr:transketolase C-terminal domain-containing protein [Candidatus Limnocylindria bacterium]